MQQGDQMKIKSTSQHTDKQRLSLEKSHFLRLPSERLFYILDTEAHVSMNTKCKQIVCPNRFQREMNICLIKTSRSGHSGICLESQH